MRRAIKTQRTNKLNKKRSQLRFADTDHLVLETMRIVKHVEANKYYMYYYF